MSISIGGRSATVTLLYERITNRTPGRADCPVHHSRSKTAVLVSLADDGRILVKCFAGCKTKDILSAINLTWSDLFPNAGNRRRNPDVDRRHRAIQGLERWRQSEIQRCAEDLRGRDALAGAITAIVRQGDITEAQAWNSLEYVYRGYAELEWRFDRLLRNQDTLALWQESRAA